MYFSVPAISFLYDVIYLQWLLFHHPFPVPECGISEDLFHQNFTFDSPEQLKGPDINSVQWYLYHRTYFPSLPHYATFLGLVKLRLSISHIPIVACSIPDILMKLLEFKSSSQEGINGGLLRTSLLTPHDVGKK